MKKLIAATMVASAVIASSIAYGQTPNTQVAAAQKTTTTVLQCTKAPGQFIRGKDGTTLKMLPGGTAELYRGTDCLVLGFVGLSDGKSVYTDDGHGLRYNNSLSVFTDGKTATVTHVSGYSVTFGDS